jgi:serine phosphatase RsbU (regulator of sigma subunit)
MQEDSVLRALFERAPVGQGFWDADLRYRLVNDRLAEINGMPIAAHIGRTPSEVLGKLGADAELALRRVLETRDAAVEMDISGETPAEPGVRRHWLASFYPVLDGVAGVIIDITERHAAAERETSALRAAETAKATAETLARANSLLGSSIRTPRVLARLVKTAVPTLADFCAVHLVDERGVDPIGVAVADPRQEEDARALAELQADPDAPVGPAAVARTGTPEVNLRITEDDLVREGVPAEEQELLGRLGISSAIILPLTARGAVLGSLTLAMGNASGRLYTPELVEIAGSLAASAGLALDNAQLFSEQAQVSAALQRTLLPAQLPHIPGVVLAARYRAAGRSNDVGGDFYDIFDAGDGDWGLVIGDVVGKGAQAAAITALVRATLQAAMLRGDDPREALALTDEALRRRSALAFCSALHGRMHVDADGVEIRLFAAGHPPPLLLRADGELEEVDVRGTLLGVAPDPTFGETTIRLDEDDTLLLYTDGATELRGANPWRGEQALRETVLGGAGSTPAELVERVERAALVHSGGNLRDDLALLAVAAVRDEE